MQTGKVSSANDKPNEACLTTSRPRSINGMVSPSTHPTTPTATCLIVTTHHRTMPCTRKSRLTRWQATTIRQPIVPAALCTPQFRPAIQTGPALLITLQLALILQEQHIKPIHILNLTHTHHHTQDKTIPTPDLAHTLRHTLLTKQSAFPHRHPCINKSLYLQRHRILSFQALRGPSSVKCVGCPSIANTT